MSQSREIEQAMMSGAAEINRLRSGVAELERKRSATEIREMLRAMQAGELTVSRGIELVDMWLAGNYRDDMLPPVRDGLGEDESPWDRINSLTQLCRDWKDSTSAAPDQLIAKSLLKVLIDERDDLKQQLSATESERAYWERMVDLEKEEIAKELHTLKQQRDEYKKDAERLDWIAGEYIQVDSFARPTGGDDADVGWTLKQWHIGESTPRLIHRHYDDNLRAAIDAAIAKVKP